MKQTLNIGLACGFGALVGTTLALQFSPSLFWLGLLVGGIVGYLTCELRETVNAVKQTASRMNVLNPRQILATLKAEGRDLISAFRNAVWLAIAESGPMAILAMYIYALGDYQTLPSSVIVGFLMSICMIIPLSLVFESTMESKYNWLRNIKRIARYTSIFTFPVWLVYWSIRGLAYGVTLLPSVAVWCFRFAWRVFILIHSERRVICFVDSVLGASIGYALGSPLIGLSAGFWLGVLNYQVVSIRLLKLKPA